MFILKEALGICEHYKSEIRMTQNMFERYCSNFPQLSISTVTVHDLVFQQDLKSKIVQIYSKIRGNFNFSG